MVGDIPGRVVWSVTYRSGWCGQSVAVTYKVHIINNVYSYIRHALSSLCLPTTDKEVAVSLDIVIAW